MLFFFRLLNIVFFLFLSFAEHTPHFSTTAQQNYQTFQPIDVASFPANNKPEIIYLKDNRTQIYELSNGQIFIKRLDLESNKEFMINLDNIESEIKFKEKSTNVSNIVNDNNPKKEFPVYEWTPLIGRNSYPHKRRGHSSIVLDNYLIYFGGCYLDLKCFNDVYFFNMEYVNSNTQMDFF